MKTSIHIMSYFQLDLNDRNTECNMNMFLTGFMRDSSDFVARGPCGAQMNISRWAVIRISSAAG